jgi:myo-inositol-hexaphosphate 3-phosphohydrolase
VPEDDTVKNATDALANKHPKNSYIAKMDEEGNIKIYDVDGNEVALNVNGKYRSFAVFVSPLACASA